MNKILTFLKKSGKLLLFSCLFTFFTAIISYADTATEITASCLFNGSFDVAKITDGSLRTHSSAENAVLSITATKPIGGVYIKYNDIPKSGVTEDGISIAENGFLHEYIFLNGKKEQTLNFEYADICDIYVFSEGTPSENVQLWQNGGDNTDILLCATHSDDDQLFFAGLLPYYAAYKKLNVQVAYFINHFDTYNRTHELLDGLWHCGVTRYPEISPFPDGYSESSAGAMSFLKSRGFSHDDVLSFQKYILNKYKPLVAVLHDFNGEYGHGAHMLNTESFTDVCNENYGDVHVPEKIYVHLYEENKIHLNFDEPLDVFGGKSAFNISQEAFMYHLSQHWTWFYGWIYGKNNQITVSDQIKSYNPCEYGLYFSSVGSDIEKDDLFENITVYSERKKAILIDEMKQSFGSFFGKDALQKRQNDSEVYLSDSAKKASLFGKKQFFVAASALAVAVLSIGVYALLRQKNTRKRKRR